MRRTSLIDFAIRCGGLLTAVLGGQLGKLQHEMKNLAPAAEPTATEWLFAISSVLLLCMGVTMLCGGLALFRRPPPPR